MKNYLGVMRKEDEKKLSVGGDVRCDGGQLRGSGSFPGSDWVTDLVLAFATTMTSAT